MIFIRELVDLYYRLTIVEDKPLLLKKIAIGINLILLLILISSAFNLISVRYISRLLYSNLGELQQRQDQLNLEYTKLEIEYATYSSTLNLQTYALKDLNLLVADKQHVMELKK